MCCSPSARPAGIGVRFVSLFRLQTAKLLHTCLSRNSWGRGPPAPLPLCLPAPAGELGWSPGVELESPVQTRPVSAHRKGPHFLSVEQEGFIWGVLSCLSPHHGQESPAAPGEASSAAAGEALGGFARSQARVVCGTMHGTGRVYKSSPGFY